MVLTAEADAHDVVLEGEGADDAHDAGRFWLACCNSERLMLMILAGFTCFLQK